MMLGNPVSQALMGNPVQMLAQSYLDQARQQKTVQQLEWALVLYDHAKATFRHIADARQLVPSLSEVKNALSQARTPQAPEEEALRQSIAEVYFERAELLEKLGKSDKAQASYRKAQAWGYEGVARASAAPIASNPVRSTRALTRAATSTSMPVQQLKVASSVQEKSVLVDYLFEKALSTLGSLEVSNKPSLFLVYAHDNPAHGQAEAETSKYLIDKLSKIQVNLYSDQTPMGQIYSSSPEDLKEDGKLEDIVTNQLCLLPTQLRGDVKPVDKVVVCCSEVLGSYLKWEGYGKFYEALRAAYLKDREAYGKEGEQAHQSAVAIREVVREFSQEEAYRGEFHHVLTEIAFLQIRKEHLRDKHGIIPVSLTLNSYEPCLEHFIPATTVRMEDIPRFENQVKAGGMVYANQSRHWVLFKLIERLLVSSDEAKTFLNKFWDGYSKFIGQLKNESKLNELEFAKLLDGIFDGIRTALHSQLAFTVQQQHQQLRVLNTEPRVALKKQYFAALKQDEAFEETLQLYVEPRGQASLDGKTETFNLLSKVQEFLNDKQVAKQVILLTGDSGAGKTTFNRVLEKHLWDNKKEYDAIPLFISLASIDKPEHDLVSKALRKRDLSEFQIQTLKEEKQKFVFILDGYDEIRQTQNLYQSNGINQSGGWQGQMVMSCRSEYLGQNYESRFQPNPTPTLQDKDRLFQEIVIEPFSEEEHNQYLKKYVKYNQIDWAMLRYQDALEQPYLKDLVSNPFLLRVVLEALPHLENEGKSRTAIQLRMDLYNQFVRQWFERNEQRLGNQNLTETKREAFIELCDDGFSQRGIRFVTDLAVHIYTENAGNSAVEYLSFKDAGNWKEAFFGHEAKQQVLREAWPLVRSGNQYRFIHKSLLEYFVVRALFDSFDECMVLDTRSRRGSAASVHSFETPPVVRSRTLEKVPLSPKDWVGDLGVVRLLTDRVKQETSFKEQLLALIERSKTDARVRQAAANAITILVKARVGFSGADLKGIRIPGADLSDGEFESVQLQEADLRKVNLRNVRLRRESLIGAQMAGVQFFVSDFVLMPTLRGHTGAVYSVAYSPSGDQIASGSEDRTVRVWDAETGALAHTLQGHTGSVNSVAYSPSGVQIASGSNDNTVRVWDAETGALPHILRGHTMAVSSVAYSPSGSQIASGSVDNTVRLWDAQTGALAHILQEHTDIVRSVVYSPSGSQIASSSHDQMVWLWDAETGALAHTLQGHTAFVRSIVYSPSGKQIASGSDDHTVRLWDAETGALAHTLQGHTAFVSSVVYSPSGEQLTSGSEDHTVRLWDAETGALAHTLQGHTEVVYSVAYSPNGDQIASGSHDKTVRLWIV
ncbi:NACHT domain-containing protein [Mycoavidus sp. SF9855]|uniref:NACHT domain-containing protein n=1 Tax=Mycoavidus sp. SF9855 TaxID=2968475 RepID=UPI00211CBA09|nr:NACHT domain-containing protein [Mycoavidus sp. SF9855]UUM20818.1 NACHT domain-containing protein [Mycoavidus sp. SF9855]